MTPGGLFALIATAEMLALVGPLHLIRQRTMGEQTGGLLLLMGKVLLLMLIVGVFSVIPPLALIVWFLGLKRLSGLPMLHTLLISTIMMLSALIVMDLLANYLQVPLPDSDVGR